MIDYRQLQAFATVLEQQSFDKAARRLHLTQSAVSQRVKQLEEQLGQLLIIRAQPLQPTETGQQLLKHYRQVELLQSELLQSLGEAQQQGLTRLAIGLNADSLATWFLDALEPLLQHNPLLLDLRLDDQDQTHHFLRQGEVIGCISASSQPVQGGRCTLLGISRYRALATPAFKQRYFADGLYTEGFKQAPAVEFNHKDELQNRYLDEFFGVAYDYPRHRVPSPQAFMDLITRGYAWGMVPDQQSLALLDQGIVEELVEGRSLAVPLHWHSWNLESQISQRLRGCLVEYGRLVLEPAEESL